MEVAQQVRGVSSRHHAGFNTEMVHDLGDFGDIPVFRKPRFMYIYIYYTIYIYTRLYNNNNNNSNSNSNKNNNNNKINTPQMMGQLWAISWESIRNQVKTLTNPIARAEPWTHMGSPRQFLGHLATSSALPAWKQTDRCVVKIFRNWVSWLYIVYWVRHILLKHTKKTPFNHWIVVGFHG